MSYPGADHLVNWFWNDMANETSDRQVPQANIVETGSDFRIELSAPGFSRDDFKIRLEEQILQISGAVKESQVKEGERFVRKEFGTKPFSRSFRLSDAVDSSRITAQVNHGILQVTIPKMEEVKAKPAKDIAIE
jgi:HSP20 family protein